jgi:hypothetical protein
MSTKTSNITSQSSIHVILNFPVLGNKVDDTASQPPCRGDFKKACHWKIISAVQERSNYSPIRTHQIKTQHVTNNAGHHLNPITLDCSQNLEAVRRSISYRSQIQKENNSFQARLPTDSRSAGIPDTTVINPAPRDTRTHPTKKKPTKTFLGEDCAPRSLTLAFRARKTNIVTVGLRDQTQAWRL